MYFSKKKEWSPIVWPGFGPIFNIFFVCVFTRTGKPTLQPAGLRNRINCNRIRINFKRIRFYFNRIQIEIERIRIPPARIPGWRPDYHEKPDPKNWIWIFRLIPEPDIWIWMVKLIPDPDILTRVFILKLDPTFRVQIRNYSSTRVVEPDWF